jgi:hypothetical protein
LAESAGLKMAEAMVTEKGAKMKESKAASADAQTPGKNLAVGSGHILPYAGEPGISFWSLQDYSFISCNRRFMDLTECPYSSFNSHLKWTQHVLRGVETESLVPTELISRIRTSLRRLIFANEQMLQGRLNTIHHHLHLVTYPGRLKEFYLTVVAIRPPGEGLPYEAAAYLVDITGMQNRFPETLLEACDLASLPFNSSPGTLSPLFAPTSFLHPAVCPRRAESLSPVPRLRYQSDEPLPASRSAPAFGSFIEARRRARSEMSPPIPSPAPSPAPSPSVSPMSIETTCSMPYHPNARPGTIAAIRSSSHRPPAGPAAADQTTSFTADLN